MNTSLLAIFAVDAWKFYKGHRGLHQCISPWSFYCKLADGLIGNIYNAVNLRSRQDIGEFQCTSGTGKLQAAGVGIHLTPTNRKISLRDGTETSSLLSSSLPYLLYEE